ncbi:MAG: SDR family oxidoreductase [Sandaracinaceae bacterium]|nr:SDR family oxidoreductase [Sandaracinaceae bacterium]
MDERRINVLITGASRGLGRALAAALAARGARVVMVARTRGPLLEAVRAIRDEGGDAHALVADVGEPGAAARIAGAAAAMVGPIDVLVNNASALGPVPLRPLGETSEAALDEVFAVNVRGAFALTRALVGSMVARGRGLVLFVSSDAAVEAYPSWGAYGASKAAADHLARVWAAELDGSGVRVLAVDPGEMDTRMHADALPDADPATLARPEAVAARLVALIERPVTAGVRVLASSVAEVAS